MPPLGSDPRHSSDPKRIEKEEEESRPKTSVCEELLLLPPPPLGHPRRDMSVMMGFGGQGPPGPASSNGTDILYATPVACGLSPHPLTTHDSGIDMMSPHDLDGHGSDSLDLPPTQEIEYHDASSSSDSRASFSDAISMSLDDYSEGGAARGGATTASLVVERPTRSRRRRRSPPKATFDINDNSLVSVYTFFKTFLGASTASTVAIDNKIEQAMDLVKSHLMFAVREEVDVLKDRIVELMDRIKHLECENTILRQYASPEVLQQIQSQMPHQQQQPQ